MYDEFWLIKDIFDFENVGFSRDVGGTVKFLSCADCENGPIGWQDLKSGSIYLCTDDKRITYSDN